MKGQKVNAIGLSVNNATLSIVDDYLIAPGNTLNNDKHAQAPIGLIQHTFCVLSCAALYAASHQTSSLK